MSSVHRLLNGVTTTQTGDAAAPGDKTPWVVRGRVEGTGAVAATIELYGNTRQDNTSGVLLGTITLSGTTSAVDGFAGDAPWPFFYAKLTAVSGTGAAVSADLGV